MSQVDLNALASTFGALKTETAEEIEARLAKDKAEQEARLAKDKADADHTRWKDKYLFIGCGAVGVVILGISAYLSWCGPDADTKKWAQSVVTALVAGIVGYLAGKK